MLRQRLEQPLSLALPCFFMCCSCRSRARMLLACRCSSLVASTLALLFVCVTAQRCSTGRAYLSSRVDCACHRSSCNVCSRGERVPAKRNCALSLRRLGYGEHSNGSSRGGGYDLADNLVGVPDADVGPDGPIDIVYTWVNGSDPRTAAGESRTTLRWPVRRAAVCGCIRFLALVCRRKIFVFGSLVILTQSNAPRNVIRVIEVTFLSCL